MMGDVRSLTREMITYIAFVLGAVHKENTWKGVKVKFVFIVGTEEQVAKASKAFEKSIIW